MTSPEPKTSEWGSDLELPSQHMPAVARTRGVIRMPPGWKLARAAGEPSGAEFSYRINGVEDHEELELSWRWRSKWSLFQLPFVTGFCALAAHVAVDSIRPWLPGQILFAVVGVYVFYFFLAELLNRTRLSLKGGRLVVRHGPLPWRGNATLAVADITQLYCMKNARGRGLTHYEVHVQMNGRERVLLRRLKTPLEALYVEQLIEGALDLRDVQVDGELPWSEEPR